jgi:hypothetical protein
MRYAAPEYTVPSSPPDDVLAELDTAARVLDELSLRAVELAVGMDEQAEGLRISLADEHGTRPLTPTELFALLAPDAR